MAINPYALCPCGSGKKIKFCCGDLAGEMEKVLRMVEGSQPAAAVRHLELLLKKHPGRASLLDLKSNIEMQLGWYEQARVTVDEYLAAEPQSVSAWARRAMQLGLAGQIEDGVAALQKSITLCDDPPYASVVLMGIRLVGRALEADDQVIPAIAHYQLYGDVSPHDDMEGEKELIRLTREEPIPELLKGPLRLYRQAADPALEGEFARAMALARRGAWRMAVEAFESQKSKAPGNARIRYNAALLHGFLGEMGLMADGLTEFASLGVSEEDAIEALALAQYLRTEGAGDLIDATELVFEIDDLERIVAARQRDRRTPRLDRSLDAWNIEEDGPPPQAGFQVLDREDPPDWSDLPLAEVPRLIASVELFGRETDRPPRAVVRLTRDAEFDAKLAAVRQLFELGDREPTHQSDSAKITALGNHAMRYSYLPRESPHSVWVRLFDQSRLTGLLEVWPATPQSALGGKSPAELIGDASRRLDLTAAVLRALETQVPPRLHRRAQEMWQRMGLAPLPDGVDPAGIDDERMWFIRVARLDAAKLSDDRLAKITLDAALANATHAIAHLAPELLKRPQLHNTVNMHAVCGAAVAEAPDYAAAAALLDEARQLISPELIPAGLWDVMQLVAAFDRFEREQLAHLFPKAAESARQSEVVAKALIMAFAERGLVTPDGRLRVPVSTSTDGESSIDGDEDLPDEPKIWTPESEAAQQGKGKIWLPS
jgi:tetratricopeptide (TPR) repeat protein